MSGSPKPCPCHPAHGNRPDSGYTNDRPASQGNTEALSARSATSTTTLQHTTVAKSTQAHHTETGGIPTEGPVCTYIFSSRRLGAGLTDRPVMMTDPFGDETYRIEYWFCPTCRYRNVGSSERLYNLRRNGRYYFHCEIATCGAGLVARQKANAPGES